jgi:hypothetical protein
VFLKAAIQAATIAETKKTLQDWLARAKARVQEMKGEATRDAKLMRGGKGGKEGESEGGKEDGGKEIERTLAERKATGAGEVESALLEDQRGEEETMRPSPRQHTPREEEEEEGRKPSLEHGSCQSCFFCRLAPSLTFKGLPALLFLVLLVVLLLLLVALVLLIFQVQRLSNRLESLQDAVSAMLTASHAQPV